MPAFVQNLLERFGIGRGVFLALVGVVAASLIWLFSYWATRPDWVALLPGIPLETVGEVSAQLDEAKIPYRLERGGSELRVREPDLARARVLLAQAGLPRQGRPGFELFDQPSWGMTDFTQRINYRRALEGELERTIAQMRGIESAQVHLAMQEASVFRRSDRSAEASVFLKLRSGIRPNAELVEAITFLVSGSVDGLTSERVTVLDDGGRILSAALESGLASGLTKRQLALQREVEGYLESKAEDLVGEVVGPGNVRVRVSAVLNFDRIDRTTQMVDPDQQVALREERSQITPTEGATVPASTIENTSYEVTRTVERFTGGQGNLRRLTVAVLLNDRLVGSGEAQRSEPRGAEELRRVEVLVRNAVGIDATRGDEISVVGVPFDGKVALAPRDEGPGLLVVAHTLQRPLLTLVALVLVFIVALQVIRAQRRPAPGVMVAALESGGAREAPEALEELEEEMPQLREARPLVPLELRGHAQVRATVDARPENAVRVIRAWLREA
jgi:flagellar M-ring protein FliF